MKPFPLTLPIAILLYPTKYVEHARLDLKDQAIALTSRFAVVDGKVDEETITLAAATATSLFAM